MKDIGQKVLGQFLIAEDNPN